jgi:hypothetical protein
MKRGFSLDEKNQKIENFTLDTAFLCFNSKFLERKIQGIKGISEVLRNVRIGFFKKIS